MSILLLPTQLGGDSPYLIQLIYRRHCHTGGLRSINDSRRVFGMFVKETAAIEEGKEDSKGECR